MLMQKTLTVSSLCRLGTAGLLPRRRLLHTTPAASLRFTQYLFNDRRPPTMTEPQAQPPAEQAPKQKSEKELAKEKAKAEKTAKFAAKQAAKKTAQPAAATPKPAKEKPAPVELPPFEDKTQPGEKKIVYPFEDPYFSAYNPKAVESSWYQWWEAQGYFKPENRRPGPSKGKFVIPLPPPNVTGKLHCGHALANSLQDTLIRWHRMRGYDTLWVPGCDHAGISTQSVVEKMLWNRKKLTRMDLGREEFVKTVWEWKGEYHQHINHAQKLMGGSMDWSREAFTLDENLSAAVKETFVRLFEEGLIYRSKRLVNWCTHLNTALSTLEVENKEIPGRTLISVPGYEKKVEFGVLTHFKYQIDGSEETIEVATTRPETMLGDSGIAVHPDDERYKHLVGKHARHPFIKDRLLPIVADTYVEKDFGTGAVKLTPAHDFNDYNLGQTHNLEFINILNDDGTLNANAGPFEGQKRFDARYTVTEELTKLGLFVKKEPNAMKIPICEKSKDVIEPLIKPQWWMSMRGMADEALKAVDDGRIKIQPESANKSYHRWMESINDWCISRQLWWGHQIPAYRVVIDGEGEDEKSTWVVGKSEEEAREKAEKKFPDKKFRLERDADCLDTWFSSGLWPMSTLGWPNTENADFKKFFPTSLLETGWDILFFWVARMIMFSLKLTGDVPFKEVYCHSLIRDSEGRKMSKSLGNVIDPLDIISGIELDALHEKLRTGNLHPDEIARAEKYQKTAFPQGIPECGSDALRFTLVSYATGGSDINFDIKVMHAYRRFCNKVWQASKYVLGKLPDGFVPAQTLDTANLSLAEKWILHRMNEAVQGINEALTSRDFSKSTKIAYQFFYDELCDVFIENSKSILQDGTPEQQVVAQNTLYKTLDTSLRMLHPFLPFITEELWQRIPRQQGDETKTIMLAEYPEYDASLNFEAEAKDYELGVNCSQGIRSLAAEYAIKTDGTAYVKASSPAAYTNVSAQVPAIRTLAGKAISNVTALDADTAPPKGCAVFVANADIAVLLDVGSKIADNVDAEIKKLKTKLSKSAVTIQKQEELMKKEGWEEKVSEVVRSAEAKKLADAKAAKENYEKTVEQFEMMRIKE